MSQRSGNPRILVLFLTYGDTYKGAFEKLLDVCGKISAEKRLIVIRNDREEMPAVQKNDWIYEMGGDNSLFEFSGWQKGIESNEAVSFSPDVYVFANDAFLLKGFYSWPVITDDILDVIARQKVLGGNLRRFGFELKYQGMRFDRYVTSHFFAMNAALVKELGTMVSETSAEKFIKPDCSGDIFTENELWDPRLKKDLLFSITHKYHEKGKKLSPEQHGFFRRKILCIANEILLSAKAGALGYRLADLVPFPRFLNSYFTIYTPFTTIRPLQCARRVTLDGLYSLFCNGFSGRIGVKRWFEGACSANLKKDLLRRV